RNLPRFRRENHRIDRTNCGWIVRCADAVDDEVAADAVDSQPTRPKRLERRASGDENRVDSCLREFSAEVPADPADANDRDLQSMRTTPSAILGKRVKTAGSCPGTISSG